MELRVLGCFGRLTPQHRSTGFLLDGDTLLDAGTVNSALGLDALLGIRRILLTHAHADHIKEIPFLLMDRANRGLPPLEIIAIPEVVETLQRHFLNGVIWPDFTQIGDPPALRYRTIDWVRPMDVGDLRVTAYPVHHTVPCAGFVIEKGDEAFAFTGDTGETDAFWRGVKRHERVRSVLAETTFHDLAEVAAATTGHYCPKILARDAAKIGRDVELIITHMRPELVELITKDLHTAGLDWRLAAQDRVLNV